MLLAQNLNTIENNAGLKSTPKDVGGLLSNVYPYIFYISGFLLLIYMIMGGFQIMFAKGDPKAVSAGWSKITNAVIGFLIVLFAYALTSILGKVFGITVFGDIFR